MKLLVPFSAWTGTIRYPAAWWLIVWAVISSPVRAGEEPLPVTEYMGRPVAQTMHYEGAPWLIRDSREREERCSLLLANLGLRRGMTVCDMGCGNGYYSLPLAKLVGPQGRVLAVDIQPEMLAMLERREADAKLNNIETILGTAHDPRLPEGAVDLILLVDVYHEFSYPEPMLAAMRRALKPDGLIALVEYRAEDPDVPIRPLHKMSKRQILKEFPANGFRLVKEFNRLPWQHLMFFGRDESWGPKDHGSH
jgi:ubiquinone/menaquinone biosynthesis C-methylase UbiE